MDKLTLNSYAKLNLYLTVLNRRRDGFHNLKTIFERIDLADKIILEILPERRIQIITHTRQIPQDQTNLAYRAAQLLQDSLGLQQGVKIEIFKRIPVGSGMGGGSSNAATVLLGLNKLWRLGLARKKIARLAAKIGSDVPFFIYDCPFALGKARGNLITPLKSLARLKFWHLLVVPRILVSTPRIYQTWDKLVEAKKVTLTKPRDNVKILTSSLENRDFSGIGRAWRNDLEAATLALYPELIAVKNRLRGLALENILMSGSGPTVFALCDSRKGAEAAYAQLKKNQFWQVFLVRTC